MPKSLSRSSQPAAGRSLLILGLGLAWFVGAGAAARADRISLRGGGVIRGKLVDDPANPTRVMFIGEAGRNPIIYKREQILQVTPEKSALDEYVARRAQERTLPEEEYQLGDWCREHHLSDLATNHFEAAIKLDPQYAPAHERLGHALVDDRWLDADGQKEAQGLVKYRGRWMQPEEKDRLEDQAAVVAENQSWIKRIKIFRDSFLSGQDARAKDAERRLTAIREVAAVGAVARVLGEDANPAVRDLAARVLGGIAGPEASSALVSRLLNETDAGVRTRTLTELGRRNLDEVQPRLIRALKSPQAMVINRAAYGLGQLDARSAVPQLISALTSREVRTEMVPIGGSGYGGGGGGGLGSVAPAGGAGFSNYSGGTYLGLTPPVVGPGVVAFGAAAVPYGSGVSIGNGGASFGSTTGGVGPGIGTVAAGVPGAGIGPTLGPAALGAISLGGSGGAGGGMMPRAVTIEHPNVEVLAALTKLTGQDFGYDAATWRRWSTSFRSDPAAPARRVLQP